MLFLVLSVMVECSTSSFTCGIWLPSDTAQLWDWRVLRWSQNFQASEPFDTSSPRSGITVSACHVDADPLTLLRWKTTGGTGSSLSPAVLYYHRTRWHLRDRYSEGPSSPFPLLCHRGISVKEEEMIF